MSSHGPIVFLTNLIWDEKAMFFINVMIKMHLLLISKCLLMELVSSYLKEKIFVGLEKDWSYNIQVMCSCDSLWLFYSWIKALFSLESKIINDLYHTHTKNKVLESISMWPSGQSLSKATIITKLKKEFTGWITCDMAESFICCQTLKFICVCIDWKGVCVVKEGIYLKKSW